MRASIVRKGMALIAATSLIASCSGATQNRTDNPCMTRGATYVVQYFEKASGTCGPLSDEVLNVDKEGGLGSSSGGKCEQSSQDGCTTRNTNCPLSGANGLSCKLTSSFTFSNDGKAATGVLMANCTQPGTTGCASTYDVRLTRQ